LRGKERKKAEREEKERVEREEKERVEWDVRERAEREAKEREEKGEASASKTPSPWGSTVGKNDRSRKTSALSQKEQKNEWGAWNLGSAEKGNPSGLPPITTSSASGGLFDNVGNFIEVATPAETADVGKLDMLERLHMNTNNVSARVSVSSRSENERWTDAGQSP